MLKNIPNIISPELLKILADMGHGDEIIITDANYPTATYAKRDIRADGIGAVEMLDAILSLIPIDKYEYSEGVTAVMQTNDGSRPPIWDKFEEVIRKHEGKDFIPVKMERFDFYERSKKAFALVHTGETALYANIIIKKGTL